MKEWKAADILAANDYLSFRSLSSVVWDALFRRDFLEERGLRFDTSYKCGCEDVDFDARFIAVCGGGVFVPRPLYRHYHNIGSSTSMKLHPELVDDILRTAALERDLFDFSSPVLRFLQFAELSVALTVYVLWAPGADMPLRGQAALMARYYDELVGRKTKIDVRGLPAKRRFLYRCARIRAFGFYLAARRAVDLLRSARVWFASWFCPE